ncbi:MAG: histidine kinase N-terminal 7TM domain-containing protein [Halorientalis sp.]
MALGVSVVVATGFAVLTWRRRPEPGTRALSVLLVSVICWTGCYAVALTVSDPTIRLWLQRLLTPLSVGTPVAWIVFALQYTGHGDEVTRRTVGALSIPAVAMALLAVTNPLHGLVWTHTAIYSKAGLTIVQQTFGLAFWAYVLYAYTLVLAGVVLLLGLVFTSEHLFADQALAMLIGALVPLVANVISLSGTAPIRGLDLTPFAFTVSGLTFGYALYQSELLERVPATRRIGRNAVVRNMRDGVVVLDDSDVVIDINPIAETQFDCEAADVVGESVQDVLKDRTFEVPDGEDTVVWSAPGPLEYEIKVSKLTDQHDRTVGRVLAVRDITDRTNRRQQLQVLNRVLRHNFRNDMNVIDVCATQLTDRLDEENAELANRIRMVARDLAETGTKAREIERIMSRRHNDPQAIDLPPLVKRQVDTIRHEYSEIDVETDMPDTLEIQSTGVLESVLQNVLENAVIHNDNPDPWIEVTVEEFPTAGEIEISVADNGPGIPAQEREVLVKGTETPLEHGSGLGLWLVNWGVSMLGGEIEFTDRAERNQPGDGEPSPADGSAQSVSHQSTADDAEPRGSVVTITIPHRRSVLPGDPSTEQPIDAS